MNNALTNRIESHAVPSKAPGMRLPKVGALPSRRNPPKSELALVDVVAAPVGVRRKFFNAL